MKKKIFFRKAGVGCVICTLALTSLTGCHKKASPTGTIEYSNIMGIAEGTADFNSVDSPEIDIKDIKSYVGQEIDYSSGIDVKNVENFDDFQMWVDATGVDIYAAGRYTATYQFVFGEKTLEKTIGVTVLEKEEMSGGLSAENQGNASGENSGSSNGGASNGNSAQNVNQDIPNGGSSDGNNGNASNGSSSDGNDVNVPNGGSSGGNNAETPNGGSSSGNNSGTPNGGSSGGNNAETPNGGSSSGNNSGTSNGGSSGGNNSGTPNGGSSGENNTGSSNGGSAGENNGGASNGGSSGGNNADASTEHREIITSSQSATKKPSTIGYTNIELLSGKYIKLRCTNARYIISTRTDESQTVKNNRTYQVSKLIITFNTGEERVLETVEKAVS